MPDSLSAIALPAGLKGQIIRQGDAGYEDARRVFNAMINRYPLAIIQAADEADVVAVVRHAAAHGLLLAVRGGGHNGGGLGVCDDGLVLDLCNFKQVRVDAEQRHVTAGAGCLWREVDAATAAHGLAVPCGIIGSTGVAGLTLGGGIGYLSRAHGLSIDNLLSARVVLADGQVVTASANEHPDLFWALRGGGGNFGVVTQFEFRAHPVSTVVAGPTMWPLERAAEVMAWYRDFMPQAPRELCGFFAMMKVPPVAPYPPELHLQTVCAVVWCHTGTAEQAERDLAPVRAMKPMVDGLSTMPFATLQGAFDGFYTPGLQWYWRADFVNELSDEAIAKHVQHAQALPTLHSMMHLYPMDGRAAEPTNDATAFAYRGARWAKVIVGVSPDPQDSVRISQWCKAYWEDLHPHCAGGAYVNFMMDEGRDRVKASYRGNYSRLAALKRRYDPDNLFRVNQNIAPG